MPLAAQSSSKGQRAPLQNHPQANKNFKFEVISIRPDKSGTGSYGNYMMLYGPSPVGYRGNTNLASLIEFAYGARNVTKISGLPSWARQDLYEINARVAPSDIPAWRS
jgi:uncharacterized protein (TIGR03435 family)